MIWKFQKSNGEKNKTKNRLEENSICMINEMRGSKNKIKNRLKGNSIYMINNMED